MKIRFNKKYIAYSLIILLVLNVIPFGGFTQKVYAENSDDNFAYPDSRPSLTSDFYQILQDDDYTINDGENVRWTDLAVNGRQIDIYGTLYVDEEVLLQDAYDSSPDLAPTLIVHNGGILYTASMKCTSEWGRIVIEEGGSVYITDDYARLMLTIGEMEISGTVYGNVILGSNDMENETSCDVSGQVSGYITQYMGNSLNVEGNVSEYIMHNENTILDVYGSVNEIRTWTAGDGLRIHYGSSVDKVIAYDCDDYESGLSIPMNTEFVNMKESGTYPVRIGTMDYNSVYNETLSYNQDFVDELFAHSADLGTIYMTDDKNASFTIQNEFPFDIELSFAKEYLYPFIIENAELGKETLRDDNNNEIHEYVIKIPANGSTELEVSVDSDIEEYKEYSITINQKVSVSAVYPDGDSIMFNIPDLDDFAIDNPDDYILEPSFALKAKVLEKDPSYEEEEEEEEEKKEENKEDADSEDLNKDTDKEEKQEEKQEEKKEEKKEEKQEEKKEEKQEAVNNELKKGTASVNANNCVLGAFPTINVNSTTNDVSKAVINIVKDGVMYDTPSEVGLYTVIAKLPANDEYSEVTVQTNFAVTYLQNPANPYSINGIEGKNGIYQSEVTVSAPAGYTIATALNGNYTDRITIYRNTDLGQIFLMNGNGEKTGGIAIDNIMIDTDNPLIAGATDNSEVYSKSLEITISDENLSAVYVNGEEVTINGNSTKITLESSLGYDSFTVKAVDKSGRESELTVTLMDEWMKEKKVPKGKYKIQGGIKYTLSNGVNGVEGDSTRYASGTSFYVPADSVITFTE